MSILKKLFGGGSGGSAGPSAKPMEYKGFTITPAPMKEGGEYRICATIEKDGKTHRLIRADVLNVYQAACDASVDKAKVMIDQMGEGLFG